MQPAFTLETMIFILEKNLQPQNICTPELITVMLSAAGLYLQSLFLGSECVDDADPASLSCQNSTFVAHVFPPRLPKIIGPVSARAHGGHMHKAPPGGVILHTAS